MVKIKEVIIQTGLTDRAIRLYIDNQLICPHCEQSFSGRKSFNFTEYDITRLKNIALLRKAGFSILDIKALLNDADIIKHTITSHINKLKKQIDTDMKIVELLETLSNNDTVTVDILCDKLSSAVADTTIPAEDIQPPVKETVIKWFFTLFAGVGIILSLFIATAMIIYCNEQFIFTKIYRISHIEDILIFLFRFAFVIPLIISIMLLTVIWKHSGSKKTNKHIKISVLSVLLALTFIIGPILYIFPLYSPPVYSETENPENYLVLDKYVRLYNEDIFELFPTVIPKAAGKIDSNWLSSNYPSTTKYYYKYENQIDPNFSLMAEWQLPTTEYEQAKSDVISTKSDMEELEKGEWKCVYFADCDEMDIEESYYFLIFAYNDNSKTVRYIAEYCMDAANGTYQPYYFALKW